MNEKIIATLQSMLNLIESVNWRLNELEKANGDMETSMRSEIEATQKQISAMENLLNENK